VVPKISRRVIRTLRQRGYLEAGLDAAVATGYDPLVDNAPELARPLAASVQQRIAFGERAGQQVRRIGAGFGAEGERPTPRQQGLDEEATDTGSPHWSWAQLLKRVFALDMARCPCCQQGALRIMAASTQGEVIRKILRHLKLAVDPPPIAPARVRQEAFAWSSP